MTTVAARNSEQAPHAVAVRVRSVEILENVLKCYSLATHVRIFKQEAKTIVGDRCGRHVASLTSSLDWERGN